MVADTNSPARGAGQQGAGPARRGQATLLDNDHGTYPFVTSSNPTVGGRSWVPASRAALEYVVGVTKAYTTRVGDGPMPTELFDERGDHKERRAGVRHDHGTARRVGWLDLPAIKWAASLNGITHVAITLLDVLSAVEEINICVGYEIDGNAWRATRCTRRTCTTPGPSTSRYPGGARTSPGAG